MYGKKNNLLLGQKTWRYSLLAAQAFPLLSVQLESHCYTGIPPFWVDAYHNSLDWSC